MINKYRKLIFSMKLLPDLRTMANEVMSEEYRYSSKIPTLVEYLWEALLTRYQYMPAHTETPAFKRVLDCVIVGTKPQEDGAIEEGGGKGFFKFMDTAYSGLRTPDPDTFLREVEDHLPRYTTYRRSEKTHSWGERLLADQLEILGYESDTLYGCIEEGQDNSAFYKIISGMIKESEQKTNPSETKQTYSKVESLAVSTTRSLVDTFVSTTSSSTDWVFTPVGIQSILLSGS